MRTAKLDQIVRQQDPVLKAEVEMLAKGQIAPAIESLVYGAPEWVRSPRLPLVGAEREQVVTTVRQAIGDLGRL